LQWWPIFKGAATYVPYLYKAERGETGGSQDARYCYAVWMRHLAALSAGRTTRPLRSVAELGPGDSLGVGLAALLSGSDSLHAFDVVRYASNDRNLSVLHELVRLFRARAPIPAADEFPSIFPRIVDTRFPAHWWQSSELDELLADERVAAIENALRGEPGQRIDVSYSVPWTDTQGIRRASVDLVYSQAVLEHVVDLAGTYRSLAAWLAPDAHTSHVIDFRSHHITPGWDGHLQYPEAVWRVVRGRRPYLLNRCAASEHLGELQANGFKVLHANRDIKAPTVPRELLADEFANWSDEDRQTATLHVVARRLRADESIPA
jgi:hypothetical protein